MEIQDKNYCAAVPYSATPFWIFPHIYVDIVIHKEMQINKSNEWIKLVNNRIKSIYKSFIVIFTDGLKEVVSGKTGFAYVIPELNIHMKQRTSDHLAVYTVEMLAILMALQWVEQNKIRRVLICSDSLSSFISIANFSSESHIELVYEIHEIIFRRLQLQIIVRFMWVPAHKDIEGNDMADYLAKQSLKQDRVMNIAFSKSEMKSIIKKQIISEWQKIWEESNKGRHLFKIQQNVGKMEIIGGNRKEQVILTRLRLGHTGLNKTLHLLGKHPTGNCECDKGMETVEHVVIHCEKYNNSREKLKQELKKYDIEILKVEKVLVKHEKINKVFIRFLKETGIYSRI
ncbi:uncharacterized protein LOC106522257 [Austrofundulus limnaeus]|uniref:Uncharacterized protein LOC106522257 n=1 Tax=Austrofundulus limnaeus TaxID=52670 RepID=A0A2I4BSC2_AUSLI|nr:PREDICTED: uncharacterized protein LOC106522257 [Austrofundulus limnaeus]